jgi:CDGSH-type Zn-finger protein
MRVTLCRCGDSANKPFCDGSHTAKGFTATGEAPTKESPALAVRNGPLSVTPVANGPLKVEGPLEVVTGTGRTILRTTETYLCRCGGSANKPYCDGTHKKIGFKAG